jgi:hypothetical protein
MVNQASKEQAVPKIRRQVVFSTSASPEQVLDAAERVLADMNARPKRGATSVTGRLGSHIVMRLLVFIASPQQLPVRVIVDVEDRGATRTVRAACEGALTIGPSLSLTRKYEARCQEVANRVGPAVELELDRHVTA